MKYLISFVGSAIALFVTAYLVPGVEILDLTALIVATVIVGLINTFIRPILRLLTLPITLVTFGLFAIVVNAITFSIAAFFAPGFQIDGIIPAFMGAIVLSIVSTVIDFFTNRMGGGKKEKHHEEPSAE